MDFWFRVIVSLARKYHKYDFHNKAIEGNGIDIGMGIPIPISKEMVQQ